jgi:hypothetical protein
MKINRIIVGLSCAVVLLIFSSSTFAQTGNPALDEELQNTNNLLEEAETHIDQGEVLIDQREERKNQLRDACFNNDMAACEEVKQMEQEDSRRLNETQMNIRMNR